MVKATSIRAIQELIASGGTLTQAQEIYKVLFNSIGLTRQEIATKTGISINAVCGRVSELQSKGKVNTGAIRACNITGKHVETLYALA